MNDKNNNISGIKIPTLKWMICNNNNKSRNKIPSVKWMVKIII